MLRNVRLIAIHVRVRWRACENPVESLWLGGAVPAGARNRRVISAIKVEQWLPEWDDVPFSPKAMRSKPQPNFFMFSLQASELRRLSGIQRRGTGGRGSGRIDTGIQRRHDPERSEEIANYVKYGFPWSALSARKRQVGEFRDLRKPGWLPTAIVVNVLRRGDSRGGRQVAATDLIDIRSRRDGGAEISLPPGSNRSSWAAKDLPPIEVIDGQHRLWAFTNRAVSGFDLPVVAFHGLDVSWQAYLFWTINIKPKRINASLAFDLYPLLRTEDWLDRFEGHHVYRETRAQEITELVARGG